MNANETLQLNVVQQLDWDPAVDSSRIGVTVKDGIVTLTGHVPTYAEKFRAEKVAKGVRGVRGVADEIEVAPPPSLIRTDSDIAAMAVQALEWDVSVPHDKIKTTVRNGYVILEGEVEWQFQRQAAEKAIRGLSGVKSIQNLIMLKLRSSGKDVKNKIVSALHRSAEDDARHIEVEIKDDTAILKGSVHTWAAREEAEDAVWAAPGINKVDNRIIIRPNVGVH